MLSAGSGKVFYFRPGHQTYPVYRQPAIQRILANAVERATPADGPEPSFGKRPDPPNRFWRYPW